MTGLIDPGSCPFRGYDVAVPTAWVDYNGHMTDSAYAVACAAANESFLHALDLSEAYRERTRRTTYTVESRIRYLREVKAGARLTAETVLVRADAKRLLVHTTLVDAESGGEVATAEYLFLHVDQESGRVVAFDDAQAELIQAVAASHAAWPRPAHLGRGVWPPT
jgi:acyl-CoA thioesterase FadM